MRKVYILVEMRGQYEDRTYEPMLVCEENDKLQLEAIKKTCEGTTDKELSFMIVEALML